MLLLVPLLVALAVVVGVAFGWKWVFAPLLGAFIWQAAVATLRSLAPGGSGAPGGPSGAAPTPVAPGERTLYWCEECGAEVLLVVRGSGGPPRHCGTRMHERTELPAN